MLASQLVNVWCCLRVVIVIKPNFSFKSWFIYRVLFSLMSFISDKILVLFLDVWYTIAINKSSLIITVLLMINYHGTIVIISVCITSHSISSTKASSNLRMYRCDIKMLSLATSKWTMVTSRMSIILLWTLHVDWVLFLVLNTIAQAGMSSGSRSRTYALLLTLQVTRTGNAMSLLVSWSILTTLTWGYYWMAEWLN